MAPSFSKLNYDVVDLIREMLNAQDIQQLQLALPAFASDCHAHVKRRLTSDLRFLGPVDVLFDLIRREHAVLWGDLVNAAINPALDFENDKGPIRFCVPEGGGQKIKQFLLKNTFTQVENPPLPPVVEDKDEDEDEDGDAPEGEGDHDNSDGIKSITKFMKGDITVEIVESETCSSVTPVVKAGTTADMNFATAELIYCGYPLLTLNHQGLLYGMLNSRTAHPNEQTQAAIAKHEKRGFRFAPTSIQWLNHHCGQSAYCPHTIRDILDSDGFVYPLREGMSASDIAQSLLLSNKQITWRLGGPPCTGSGPSMSSFTALV